MGWRKYDLWKISILITSMLFLFVLLMWASVSVANAHEVTSGLAAAGTVTVQATPTEDATVTALNKEKLAQEVQQLKKQNEPDFLEWLQTNATLFSTLLVVIGGLIGLFRWFGDRRSERERRAEERFQSAVTGLGDEKEGARVGAAVLLRTFLRPGYEQFYTQTFDLAIANLRLPRTAHPAEDPDAPLPLTTLSQALIMVFKEALPLARSQSDGDRPSLDARSIQLDNAYLRRADLKQVWMPQASLRRANIRAANLRRATLWEADFREADLREANLRETRLWGANLRRATLWEADFREADLRKTDLWEADLRKANLRGVELWGANLEDALSLEGTDLHGVKGLTKEQLEACQAKGAIIDEDSTISSSQSPVSPSLPESRDDTQAS